jgi:quinol-cytochrome oxidoreductase complex cytochrome b subunit
MKLQLKNPLIVTLLICAIWMFAMRVVSSININQMDVWLILFVGVSFAAGILTHLVHLQYHKSMRPDERQRKVEKLLSQLDSEERSILFNRLATPEDDGETLEAFLSEQKRKRS